MSKAQYIDEYRRNAVLGASPLGLIVMLYDGAIKFVEQSREAMAEGDLFRKNQCLQKAQKIISELMSCLDMQRGGEVAQNLLALYTYVYNQTIQANIDDNPEGLEPVLRILRQLRESWDELERRQRETPGNMEVAHAS